MLSTHNRKYLFSKDYLLLLFGVLLFICAGVIHSQNKKPGIVLTKQDSAININNNVLLFMSAGNKRLLADLLWVQTLIESDLEHYSQKDLNNWMYLRFKSISILDPKFYENYLYGGLYLSIVKDDVMGAAEIYDKGLKFYPNDYQLNYNAGFNQYFEIGDFEKGLTYLENIVEHPDAAPFLPFLVNKLRFVTSNDFDTPLQFLIYNYNSSNDPVLRKKLAKDIYALKAERDLTCLNSGKNNCEVKDAEGNFYKKIGDTWKSQKDFVPYRIHRKQGPSKEGP